jgi:hypothetical protein
MRRVTLFALSVAVAVTLAGTRAFAQHGGGHAGGMGGGGAAHGDMDRGSTARGTGQNANMPSMQMKNPDQVLSQNTHLSSRLQSLLPAGTNLQQAASGFKNLGQFIAAVHVSHNLGIPFDELKGKITGASPVSLGKAIQELKPQANAKEETKRANKQAKEDLSESAS